MNFTRRVVLASASAAALTLSLSSGAVAQTEIYGGGATLPSLVLRDMFNCRTLRVDDAAGSFNNTTACNGTTRNSTRVFGYASVGSGRGLVSFTTRSSSGLGIPAVTETVPYTSVPGGAACVPPLTSPSARAATPATGLNFDCALPNPPSGYASHHFSVSEQPLPQVNTSRPIESLNCYQGTGGTGCTDQVPTGGQAIQVPVAVAPVNVAYNLGGFTSLRLSERALCGIFTGVIKTWDHPDIRAANGGVAPSTLPVRVVRRSDSSGTTFLFVNHLANVCSRTPYPWPGGTANVSTLPAFPVTTLYYAAPGNAGVAGTVARTPGAIGYASPSFTQFPDATGPVTIDIDTTLNLVDATGANPITVPAGTGIAAPRPSTLQNRLGQYREATLRNATTGMSTASPPTGAAAANPANWSAAGLVPDPNVTGSYPIVGFFWMMHYTCYRTPAVVTGIRDWWIWNLTSQAGGSLDSRDVLRDRGFAVLPATWRTAVRDHLLNNSTTQLSGVSGSALRNPTCSGRPGA
jgi:ABC-type phosphate transport system substrate-binding protein